MASGRKKFTRALTGWISIGYVKWTRLVPVSVARKITCAFGRILLALVPRLHKVGMDNLNLAYGDTLTHTEKKAILRGAMDNICTVAAEFSRIKELAESDISGVVKVVGQENVKEGKGHLIIGAHLGSWEWMIPTMNNLGYRVAAIYRPNDFKPLDQLIIDTRSGPNTVLIPKDNAGANLIAELMNGALSGLAADQSPRDNAVPTTFFGQPCWSTIGPAMLSFRAQVPILMLSLFRQPDGTYEFRFYPLLELDHGDDLLENLVSNTQKVQDELEKLIRQHPEQWLWFHRRWKKRPRLEKEWAERLAKNEKDKAEKAG